MVAVPLTVSTDFSHGGSIHLYVPIPPVPPAPVPMAAIEVPIPQAWPPGVALGSVKKTSSVLANGHAVIQAGHDCGKLIPQVTIPPNNALLPLLIVGSSREVIVKCFSVRMNKLQTACTSIWPPMPMLSCGQPVSMPLTFTLTNVMRGIFVGASVADILGAIIATLGRMAIDALFAGPMGVKLPFVEGLGKSLLGTVVGTIASIVQHAIDPRYPITVDVKVKAGGLDFGVSVSCDSSDTKNNPSQVTVSVTKKFDPSLDGSVGCLAGGKVGASVTTTWDAGGDASKEGVVAQVGAQGAVGVVGGQVGVSGEYHPNAPAGQQASASVQGGINTAAGSASGSATGSVDPNAPGGPQGTGTVAGKVDTPAGSASGSSSTSGSLPSSGTVWQPPPSAAPPPGAAGAVWQAPQPLPTPPPGGKSAVWQPPGPHGGDGVWGPSL